MKKYLTIKKEDLIYFLFLFLISLISIIRSVYIASHNIAPLPTSYFFYDSYQITNGYILYKDIFPVVYGPLTPIIFSFFLNLFGSYVLSLTIGTSIIYSFTFVIFFYILQNFNFTKTNSLIVVFAVFFIHPGITVPLSNYIAYFFLILGFLFFSLSNRNIYFNFLFGVFLGLSILSRQTFILPILFLILSTFFFKKFQKIRILIITGLSMVIFIFFLYLVYNDLLYSWYIQSFNTWDIYSFTSLHPSIDKSFGFFNYVILIIDFFKLVFFSVKNFDLKWTFYLILLSLNLYLLFDSFCLKKDYEKRSSLTLISVASVFLFSESLHSPAIFRLSTGSIIGIIPISALFFNNQLFKNKKIIILFLITFFIFFYFTLNRSYKNFKEVTNIGLELSEPDIDILKYQKFPLEVSDFYKKFNSEIIKMHSIYKINYSYNITNNPLLPIISKTRSAKISSYFNMDGIYNMDGVSIYDDFANLYKYYPTLTFNEAIKKKSDNMVVFINVKNVAMINQYRKKIDLDNFFIFSELHYPLHENQKVLLMLISKNIKKIN